MVKKGEWVRIKKVLLPVGQRAPQDPEDTKATPLVMWTKGFLKANGEIGDEVEVTTAVGRTETGELTEVNPYYTHNYGKFVPEIVEIDKRYREFLFGGDE
ncbi:MAG TPA: 2-amino-4-oxopentanoate thiolase subunit OrtA [Anaerovoracaceae bacterium]|nr:2-amino-4-oxopentanoate thiolase subunit OrtA [Anaerovoracaceae bacterium]